MIWHQMAQNRDVVKSVFRHILNNSIWLEEHVCFFTRNGLWVMLFKNAF